jgi:hypothetical protein
MVFFLVSVLPGLGRTAEAATIVAAPLAVEAVPAGMFFRGGGAWLGNIHLPAQSWKPYKRHAIILGKP